MPISCDCCPTQISKCVGASTPGVNATFGSQAGSRSVVPGGFLFTNFAGSGINVTVTMTGDTLAVGGQSIPNSLTVPASSQRTVQITVSFSAPVYLRRFGIEDLDFGGNLEFAYNFSPPLIGVYGQKQQFFATQPAASPSTSAANNPAIRDNANNGTGGASFNALTTSLTFSIFHAAGAGSFLNEVAFDLADSRDIITLFRCAVGDQWFDTAGNVVDPDDYIECDETCPPLNITDLHMEGRAFNNPADGFGTDEYIWFSRNPTTSTATQVASGAWHSNVGNPNSPCGGKTITFDWTTSLHSLVFTYSNDISTLPVGGVVVNFSSVQLGGEFAIPIFASGGLVPGGFVEFPVTGGTGRLTYLFGPVNGNGPRGEAPFCGTAPAVNTLGLHRATVTQADQPIIMRLDFFKESCPEQNAVASFGPTLATNWAAFDDGAGTTQESICAITPKNPIGMNAGNIAAPGCFGSVAGSANFFWQDFSFIELEYTSNPGLFAGAAVFNVQLDGVTVSWPVATELAIGTSNLSNSVNGHQLRLTAVSGGNGFRPRWDSATQVRVGNNPPQSMPTPVRFRIDLV